MEETLLENENQNVSQKQNVTNDGKGNVRKNKKSSDALGVAASAAGGAVFGAAVGVAGSAAAAENDSTVEQDVVIDPEPGSDDSVHAWDGELDVAHTNYDNMSFNDAFAAARAEVGPGGMFIYHGHPYNTFYADEYAALTDEEKVDFQQQVNNAVHDPSNHHDIEPVTPVVDNGIEVPIDLNSVTEDNIEIVDIDGDNNPDAVVIDTNNDDVPDAVLIDIDSDGNIDVVMDSNADGVLEVYHNVNENGYAESVELIDTREPSYDLEPDSELASLSDSELGIDNDMNMSDYA